jgi:hypothetical protein
LNLRQQHLLQIQRAQLPPGKPSKQQYLDNDGLAVKSITADEIALRANQSRERI